MSRLPIMSALILADTDLLVDFLRGNQKALDYVAQRSTKIVLSAVAVAELYAGVKGNSEMDELDEFISLFPVLPVTAEIAKAGGLYKQQFAASHGTGLADALIAATAEAHDAQLKTLNTKHFPMLKGLKAPYRKP